MISSRGVATAVLCVAGSAFTAALLAAPRALPRGPGAEKAGGTASALAAARLDAARQTYELLWRAHRAGVAPTPGPEKVYLWSRRWLEAEHDLSPGHAERVAALEGHFRRMRQLEEVAGAAETLTGGPTLRAAEARFYRAEAELWLAEGRSR